MLAYIFPKYVILGHTKPYVVEWSTVLVVEEPRELKPHHIIFTVVGFEVDTNF